MTLRDDVHREKFSNQLDRLRRAYDAANQAAIGVDSIGDYKERARLIDAVCQSGQAYTDFLWEHRAMLQSALLIAEIVSPQHPWSGVCPKGLDEAVEVFMRSADRRTP